MKKFAKYACLALSTLCLSACNISSFFSTDSESSPVKLVPGEMLNTNLGRNGLINSLGKWNYYAAKKTIADYGKTPTAYQSLKASSQIRPMASSDYHVDSVGNEGFDKEDAPETPNESLWIDTEEEGFPSQNRPQDTDTVRYYDLYTYGELTIERTVYFQMELTEEDGFLARHLGVGTVEVAVALGDYLADLSMITFRNGENFYSCMYHGYEGFNEETGAEIFSFAAYRYIDGFYYVKNLQWEHYKFYLEVGTNSVGFYCDYTYSGEETETVNVVVGSSYCIDQKVTYTIEELETYFNGNNVGETASENNVSM